MAYAEKPHHPEDHHPVRRVILVDENGRTTMRKRWPDRLWIVRHGESAGNVARDAAMTAGLAEIDIAGRDVDVPLSALGEQQSRALGRWFAASRGRSARTWCWSRLRRAQQTAA